MNFIKNITKKYICEYCVIKRQKIVSHNSFTIFNIRLDKFIYNNLVESLFSIDFNNARYFIIFKDEIFVIFLKFKVHLNS